VADSTSRPISGTLELFPINSGCSTPDTNYPGHTCLNKIHSLQQVLHFLDKSNFLFIIKFDQLHCEGSLYLPCGSFIIIFLNEITVNTWWDFCIFWILEIMSNSGGQSSTDEKKPLMTQHRSQFSIHFIINFTHPEFFLENASVAWLVKNSPPVMKPEGHFWLKLF